jgi:gluconate 2-dehydrogenase gamma chain
MTENQRATLTAAIDRIVPRDDFPSASEAGVLDFLDRLIVLEGLASTYEVGLHAIDQQARDLVGKPFVDLSDAEQDAVLQSMEDTPFFRLLAEQTVEGYYADPGNGGNRDAVAWEMVGFRVTA